MKTWTDWNPRLMRKYELQEDTFYRWTGLIMIPDSPTSQASGHATVTACAGEDSTDEI